MGAQATEGGGLQPEGLFKFLPASQLRETLVQLPDWTDDYDGHHTGLMCTHGALDTGLGGRTSQKGWFWDFPWQSSGWDSIPLQGTWIQIPGGGTKTPFCHLVPK